MRIRILLALLGLLLIGATLNTSPPPPPGLTTSQKKFLSPKASELKTSLGSAMAIAPTLLIPSQFAITNITLNAGNFILSWNSNAPGPYQIWGKPSLTSSWSTQENITILLSQTFPQGENQFWKVQAQIPLLFLHTNSQPRLTWAVPQIAMSDSLQDFIVQRRSDDPPPNQAISDDTGWTTIGTVGPTVRAFEDTTPVPAPPGKFGYRLKQTTAGGVVIPYPVQFLTRQQGGTPLWVRGQLGTGIIQSMATTIASDGGYLVAGMFNGTCSFDPGNSPGSSKTADGFNNIFIAKYSSAGAFQWVKQYKGGNAYQFGSYLTMRMAVLSTGDIILSGSLNVNPGPITANLGGADITSTTQTLGFLARYESDGDHVWSFGFVESAEWKLFGLAVDSSDRIVISGYLRGAVGINAKIQQPDGNGPDFFVRNRVFAVQLTSGGIVNWTLNDVNVGGTFGNSDNMSTGVTVDPSGNVYIVGQSFDTNFGGGLRTEARSFLAKYNSSGVWQFDVATTTPPFIGRSVCKWTPNGIAIAGYLFGSTVVNGQTIYAGGGGASSDPIVLLFSASNGAYINHTYFTDYVNGADALVNGMAVDSSGIYITGFLKYDHLFGTYLLNIINQGNAYVAKLNYNLQVLWAIKCGRTVVNFNGDTGNDIAVDSLGNAVCVGVFCNESMFGTLQLTAGGNVSNGYLMKVSP